MVYIYNKIIIFLFEKLNKSFLKRNDILIFQSLNLENKLLLKRAFKQLRKESLKSLNILQIIDIIFNKNLIILNSIDFSDKIQNIVSNSYWNNIHFSTLKNNKCFFTKKDKYIDENIHNFMKKLADNIDSYNYNFNQKVTSFKEAKQIAIEKAIKVFDELQN